MNFGWITETDQNYNAIGTYAPYDLALSFGYARKLDEVGLSGFTAGAAVKYVQSKILDTAQTAAFDFGVLSPAYLDKRLELALTVTNLGGALKYDQSEEEPAADAQGGGSLQADAAVAGEPGRGSAPGQRAILCGRHRVRGAV